MQSRPVFIAATMTVFLYAIIAWLSWQFDYHSDGVDRPILAVMGLFAGAFLIYLAATVRVYQAKANTASLKWIVGAAIVFRLVMLFSLPIQEVDLYRYMWDGAVTGEGISPFAHSPQSILQAVTDSKVVDLVKDPQKTGSLTRSTTSGSVRRLVTLVDREPGIGEVLGRVHFPELPTIYPATSQAVFALVDMTTLSRSSLLARVYIMKAWLIGFDVATLFTVIALLRRLGKPATWCIAYAWCPLLMKEVAGSGHLDAITVFLTTLTIYLAVRLVTRETKLQTSGFAVSRSLALIGFVFALAIGAKLYPIILAPLLMGCVAVRFGWRHTVVPVVTTCLVTACLLWPMLPSGNGSSAGENSANENVANANATDPSEGVATFLKHWEMNDFLFLILIENLKPTDMMPPGQTAWFSVMPLSARAAITAQVTGFANIDASQVPFLVSRAVTIGVFFVISFWLAWRATRSTNLNSLDPDLICEAAFLTLAWFWLLAPTQNPWYWTWALPLLPFARGRAWFVVSGLVLVYYLRFWFEYHYEGVSVLGTRYQSVVFYDLVITWVEFAPWMIFLAVDAMKRVRTHHLAEPGR